MEDTTNLITRRSAALGTGAPLFYDDAVAYRPGRRRVSVRRRRPPLCRHVQQRALCRTCQSRSRRGNGATAGHAERAQPLSARRHHRLRRTPGRAARAMRSRASCSAAPAPKRTKWRCAWRASPRARRGIVCTNATYHGNSEAVGVLTRIGAAAERTRDVRAFPFPESYRPLVARRSAKTRCATPIWSDCSGAIAQSRGRRQRLRRR